MAKASLSPKERAFVVAYLGDAAGNASKASILAGYAPKSAAVTGSRLLRKANIAAHLAKTRADIECSAIADAAERREIVTALLRSGKENGLTRLKAADVLNKMDGLYIQKHQHEGVVTLEHILGEAAS